MTPPKPTPGRHHRDGAETALLTAGDINRLLDLDQALASIRAGFLADHTGLPTGQRIRTDLPGPGTANALLPGLLPDIPAYTVKVNAKFPAARPALRGVVCLFSLVDGTLLDSASLTAWRTGLAAALGTHLLGAPEATVIGLIGAGAQGRATLTGLRHLRQVDRVVVHDPDPAALDALHREHPDLAFQPVAGPQAVAMAAPVVILATWSRTPLLWLTDLSPGQHLTSLGADEPGKAELATDLLQAARLVVDNRTLATSSGVLTDAALQADAVELTVALRAPTPSARSPACPGHRCGCARSPRATAHTQPREGYAVLADLLWMPWSDWLASSGPQR